jgi:hypothetical protein
LFVKTIKWVVLSPYRNSKIYIKMNCTTSQKQKQNLVITFLASAIIFFCCTAQAQTYNTGIGIRLGGFEQGLTVKHFTNSKTAIEGILGIRPGVFVLTGLYEKHAKAFDESSLKWFYGIGAHIGSIGKNNYYKRFGSDRYYTESGILLGADAILGLEWDIPELPISLTADLHPRLELVNGAFIDMAPALSIRYTF